MRRDNENHPDHDTETTGQTGCLFYIIREGGIVSVEKRPPSEYPLPDIPCHNATPFASIRLGLGLAHYSPSLL
jgi:hypothetical protein